MKKLIVNLFFIISVYGVDNKFRDNEIKGFSINKKGFIERKTDERINSENKFKRFIKNKYEKAKEYIKKTSEKIKSYNESKQANCELKKSESEKPYQGTKVSVV